eukprot:CAMPEP_0197563554 /NCGR_PEP_ID=MMETSP1320-20131121/28974_1 /TAXON_ID=91990 /ORGANISM="Bolidomonas sp., Strain RCC2347" /LENGTH=86 /DNA_ID=CAMNT_0043125377 /DNA_START=30 /DNA_END=287 /DNA_ORIENTATION=+
MYGVPEGDVQGVLGKFDGPSVFEKCHAAFAQFCSEDNAGGDNDDDLGTLEEQLEALAITNPEIKVSKTAGSVVVGPIEHRGDVSLM